jgi:hypothetical protein
MSMPLLYSLLLAVSVCLWVPIFLRFYRAWTTRRNPISLSICAAITLIIWESGSGLWVVMGQVGAELAAVVVGGLSLAIGLWFHIAFFVSERRFGDSRRSGGNGKAE